MNNSEIVSKLWNLLELRRAVNVPRVTILHFLPAINS